MNRTDIEYLGLTWNPVAGCTNGCSYCWARRQAKRQKHNCRKCYAFTPHLHPERLDEPLKKRKPSVIGVAFMGDLFDPAFVLNPIFRWTGKFAPEAVLEIMDEADWHTFVLLTKQPQLAKRFAFPPNLVLGVSPTDQESAERLIPELMECKASTRIVSIEPMRGAVDLASLRTGPDQPMEGFADTTWHPCGNALRKWKPPADWRPGIDIGPSWTGLDGIILGGQTGPDAVPMDPDWVRAVRDQCAGAGVPFFFKGWGEWKPGPLRACKQGLDDCWRAVNDYHVFPNGEGANRVGRKAAGRMLDGRKHDELAWTAGLRREA